MGVKRHRIRQRFYVYQTFVNRLQVKTAALAGVLLRGAPGLESVKVYIKG